MWGVMGIVVAGEQPYAIGWRVSGEIKKGR